MSSGRKLALIVAAVLYVGMSVFPLAAQQRKWEELNAQVKSLYGQGKYAEAVPKALEALHVAETSFGSEHINVARSLNKLAELYHAQGKYAEAEPLYKRSLAIREKALGPDHPDVALV